MSLEQDQGQELRQRKRCSSPLRASPIRQLATVSTKPKEHRGCWRGLAIIFSFLSTSKQHSPRPKAQRQITDDEVQLQAIQDTAPEEHRMIPAEMVPELCNPYLENIKLQAKIGGWYIEPDEIEIQEKIGQGTTADIYRGTWRGLDVAVKWIYPQYFLKDEYGEAWLAQELDILSRQRHPYMLRLLGASIHPPQYGWIITELLSGKTLTEWLYGHKERSMERSITLPPLQERIKKGLEIAQGMQYLHEQKPIVIHRDLKPSNILLDDSMHVRIADFGHARYLSDGEQALTGEMGTYVYMAPEVIRSEPYDEKCDVYSYAIILNELITAECPYNESNYGPTQIALEVAEGRLRPKLPEEDCLSKELIQLVCSAWYNDASARPTFAIITSALKKIIEKLTVSPSSSEEKESESR